MWRFSDSIYVFHSKTGFYEKKQFSENDKEVTVWTGDSNMQWGLAVFDGAGETCDYWGHVIGEYRVDKVAPDGSVVYRARGGQTYLSKEGSEWVVHGLRNETPMIYLKNASNHSKPPNNGWMYNNNGTFVLDPVLLLSTEPVPPQECQVITITSTSGASAEYLGIFTRTDKYLDGRPVFVNKNGKFLKIISGYSNWGVGDSIYKADAKVCSASASLCPAAKCARSNDRPDMDIKSWFYITGARERKEDTTISVACDVHKHN